MGFQKTDKVATRRGVVRQRTLALLAILLAPLTASAVTETPAARYVLVLDEGVMPPDGVKVIHRYATLPGALVAAAPDELARLAALPGVLAVYPDAPLESHLDLARPVLGLAGGGAPRETGAGVTIALVDAGIDANHPALRGRVEAYAVTASGVAPAAGPQGTGGHGTEVAGVLAGNGAESPGSRYAGIAPGARIVALDIGAQFTVDGALRAFDWIHEHRDDEEIRIVTNSWGRTDAVDGKSDPRAPLVLASDTLALDDGMLVVFSAGNRGRASSIAPEALNPNVLTVGATDAGGRLAAFSSRGPGLDAAGAPLTWTKPDLVAVGDGVVTTRPLTSLGNAVAGDRSLAPAYYGAVSGTSFAAPMAAGAAALLLEARPGLTREEVARALVLTARDVGAPGPDAEAGAGLLDARLALELARASALPSGREARTVEVAFPPFEIVSAGGVVAGLAGAPSVEPAGEVVAYVPVLPGSASLRAEATWTSSAPAAFAARLVPPSGAGTVPLSGSGSRLAAEVRAPEPGVWELRAQPSGPVAQASLTLAGASAADRMLTALSLREGTLPLEAAASGGSANVALGIAIALVAAAAISAGVVVVGQRAMRR